MTNDYLCVIIIVLTENERKTSVMINKAFEIVNRKVEAVLSEQGYVRRNVTGTDSNELVTLYTGETTAYSILYYKDKKHMVMRSCAMTEDGPDNEWKTIGTWMFDPETDKEREAESIGNDFADNVTSPMFIQASKVQKKKKKKDDDGSGDPLFFAKRLVAVFPDLKEEIKNEEDSYEQFRGVTFTREFILPKVKQLMTENDKSKINKFAEVLSSQYAYCDMDTRSIITIVILNYVQDEELKEMLRQNMSDELVKAWKAAEKYRGKKVKPAKKKKPGFMQKMMEQSIENRENYLNQLNQ